MKRLFIVIFLLWINDLVFTDTTLYISNLWGRYSISIFRVVRKEKIFKKLNSPFIAFMVLLSLACCNWKIKCYGSFFFLEYISMGVKIFTGFYIFVLLLCVSWDIVMREALYSSLLSPLCTIFVHLQIGFPLVLSSGTSNERKSIYFYFWWWNSLQANLILDLVPWCCVASFKNLS